MPSVRITSGRFKNRVLTYAPGPHLRPTTHRTRQMVFNILNHRFCPPKDLEVLDAFAGLGAYGFEALSLRAKKVTFIEANAASAACLHDFAVQLKVEEHVCILQGTIPECMDRLGGPYDLIFMDPPYAWPPQTLEHLVDLLTTHFLREEGILVLETPRILATPLLARKAGLAFISFYASKATSLCKIEAK